MYLKNVSRYLKIKMHFNKCWLLCIGILAYLTINSISRITRIRHLIEETLRGIIVLILAIIPSSLLYDIIHNFNIIYIITVSICDIILLFFGASTSSSDEYSSITPSENCSTLFGFLLNLCLHYQHLLNSSCIKFVKITASKVFLEKYQLYLFLKSLDS